MERIQIEKVVPGSIAEEAGIEPGDFLKAVNRKSVEDIFDYRFLTSEEELLLTIEKADGEEWEIEIEKDQYEDIGIEFRNALIDEARHCTNQCIFCFIDQLPQGMRETLYFKDDDSRLSFLQGNYITLTNMKDSELERIVKYKMSPVNISVHTTNPALRKTMLGNRFAGGIMEKIRKLADGGIQMNGQIVLCRGINDGEELDRTVGDLTQFYPFLYSISVVPVGLTKYRNNLFPLAPFDREGAREVIKQVEGWQMHFLEQHETRIVYLADEFYLKAGLPIPGYEHYEDFPQIENGVGLLALLQWECNEYLRDLKYTLNHSRKVSIATGVAAHPFIEGLCRQMMEQIANLDVKVYPIINHFFGQNVTVAGLVTGQDIRKQLEGKDLGQGLFIPASMLRSGEMTFLDDYTVERLEKELGVPIVPVQNSGPDFVNKVLGG